MHGIDLNLVVHFYTDASGFGAGLAITQFQKPDTVDTSGTKDVEVPIVYNSFLLAPTRRKYPIYKRELYAIVTFVTKYDYLCKHPYLPAVVHTDHKPLVHFLTSDLHEGIYGHWADKLRRLNINIVYIPGHRNKIADALSRTIFDSNCSDSTAVHQLQKELTDQGPQWIWKDGKGGFEEFIASLDPSHKSEVLEEGTVGGLSVFSLTAVPHTNRSWKTAYENSEWFGECYRFHLGLVDSPTPDLVQMAYNFRVVGDILWIHRRERFIPCIPEGKVLQILREAHDEGGHWAKTGTLAKLRGRCYWPQQSQDVEKYIAGCLECARYGPATRSQPLHPVLVIFPFQLLGMDFVGPFTTTQSGHTYILVVVCYFSRFVVPFATRSSNVEDVIWCLDLMFSMYRAPQAFYCDKGQHFDNEELREWLHGRGVAIDYSPSGASKSTGMVESNNRRCFTKNHCYRK